jgi:hypothetical protein
MTIFFPDISSYEAGLTIQPGTVAVIAKATEGTYYRDAQYASFKAQAARVGAVFSAYHFLKAGNGAGQADYCHAMVGSTPVMLDVETEGASKPTVADCADFINRMRTLGGRVWGAYFPQWYWQQVGGNLASLGVAVVASNYTAYSDTGPGWSPYGGVTPAIWQYTDKQPYGGQTMDFDAYKGTVQQLAALINGTTTSTPNTGGTVPAIPSSIGQKWPEIANQFVGTYDDSTAIIWADAGSRAAALYAQEARDAVNALAAKLGSASVDVNALAAQLGPLLHPTTDVNALAAALAPHVGAPDPVAFAAALAPHIKVTSA